MSRPGTQLVGGTLIASVVLLAGCALREVFAPSDSARVARLAAAAREERLALERTLAVDAAAVIAALDAEVAGLGAQLSLHGELGPVVEGNRLVTVVAGRAALHLDFAGVRALRRSDDPARPFAGTVEVASTRTQVQVQVALLVSGIAPGANLAHLASTLDWPPDLPEPVMPSRPQAWPPPALLVATEAEARLAGASPTASSGSHLVEFVYDSARGHWVLAEGRTPTVAAATPATLAGTRWR